MNIKLELTVDQVNTILQSLGNMPYVQVHELINTIQQQGASQLNHGDSLNANHQESTEE